MLWKIIIFVCHILIVSAVDEHVFKRKIRQLLRHFTFLFLLNVLGITFSTDTFKEQGRKNGKTLSNVTLVYKDLFNCWQPVLFDKVFDLYNRTKLFLIRRN